MYQYSFDWFTKVFRSSIENSNKSNNIEKRLRYLKDHLTFSLYCQISYSLQPQEGDGLIFAFLLCCQLMMAEGVVHQILSPIPNSESTNFFNEYLLWFLFQLANWEKTLVLNQWEVCFLFQLLKLRKIRGKNSWNKLVKFSDEFVKRWRWIGSQKQYFRTPGYGKIFYLFLWFSNFALVNL